MSNRKQFFPASVVADVLESLKDGNDGTQWWVPASQGAPGLTIRWASPRKGANNTQWISVDFTDRAGVSGGAVLRINNERVCGSIMPNTDAGVAEMAATHPKLTIVKRDKKPTIQFQKWSSRVGCAEDGVTILCDEDGQQILPGDEHRSAYYRAACLINEAFLSEASERVERGNELVSLAIKMRRADKAATVEAILTSFLETNGPRRQNDAIISTDSINSLRKLFPVSKEVDTICKGALIAAASKTASLIQEYIGANASKNANQPLPNPLTRVSLNFEANGMPSAGLMIYDKTAKFVDASGKEHYENGKVDGVPINADNVHKFIISGSRVDGFVKMDSVSLHSLGLSIPTKFTILVVSPPVYSTIGIDDVYDEVADAETAIVSAEQPSGLRKRPAAAGNDQPAGDYIEMLSDLGV